MQEIKYAKRQLMVVKIFSEKGISLSRREGNHVIAELSGAPDQPLLIKKLKNVFSESLEASLEACTASRLIPVWCTRLVDGTAADYESERGFLLDYDLPECVRDRAAERAAEIKAEQEAATIAAKRAVDDTRRAAEESVWNARLNELMSMVVIPATNRRGMGSFGLSGSLEVALKAAGATWAEVQGIAIKLGIYSQSADPDDVGGGGYSKVE